MSAARKSTILAIMCGFGLGLTACAQSPCMEGCDLVHYTASTPQPQEACFTAPDGRTRCQSYVRYRTDDRYERLPVRDPAPSAARQ